MPTRHHNDHDDNDDDLDDEHDDLDHDDDGGAHHHHDDADLDDVTISVVKHDGTTYDIPGHLDYIDVAALEHLRADELRAEFIDALAHDYIAGPALDAARALVAHLDDA